MDTTAIVYSQWKERNVTRDVFKDQKCMFVSGTGDWHRENCEKKLYFLCKFNRMRLT